MMEKQGRVTMFTLDSMPRATPKRSSCRARLMAAGVLLGGLPLLWSPHRGPCTQTSPFTARQADPPLPTGDPARGRLVFFDLPAG
jgi:hypothetical protein